jgi:hypothetical protein
MTIVTLVSGCGNGTSLEVILSASLGPQVCPAGWLSHRQFCEGSAPDSLARAILAPTSPAQTETSGHCQASRGASRMID